MVEAPITKDSIWTGEMTQGLRALTVLRDRPGFTSQNIHGFSQASVTPISGSQTRFMALGAHAYMQAHTHI